jgi:mono/diheme cytochrome c family protein
MASNISLIHPAALEPLLSPTLRLCLICLSLAGSALEARAQAVDFGRDVFPVLRKACFECHGAEKQRGDLRLDSRAAALRGGETAPALVPGKPLQSELYSRILLPAGEEGTMPARGDRLTKQQVDAIRVWIENGAPWPDNVSSARHWAYVPPVRAPLPAVRAGQWPRTAVDRFVLARLEQEGLRPSPAADHYTLIRRLSLDLIGLPPTPEEVDDFEQALQQDAQAAVATLVDRLLASPHFGERWARPWLDLARYADSHGFQRDDFRNSWAYRDWVIRALNDDMPFDRFTLEQVAGDLLPGATLEQKIATGFHRGAPTNVEAGSDPEETRVNQVFDRVNTTAAVWLGTTFECAQCHDHKYDPFTMKDYYRLFAFFNNTAIEADRANPKVQSSIQFMGPYLSLGSDKDATTVVMQELKQPRPTHIFKRGSYRDPGERVTPGAPALLPPLPEGPPDRRTLAQWLTARDNPLAARVTVNRWWAELFGRGLVGTLEDFGVKGEPPSHPELLDWLAVELMDNGWSMKKLLRHIVLSATYQQSARLTPELRAKDDQNRLLARGPRFRMDAEMIRDNALAVSGLLSRKQAGPPVRPYQPEGLWNRIGGVKVAYVMSPGADRYRRGVYVVWKRSVPYPSFVNFDATARYMCTVKRSRSNTPLQALTLLNDPVYVEAALALASRAVTEAPSTAAEERLRHAFRLCLARPPRENEIEVLRRLLDRQSRDVKTARDLVGNFPLPPQMSAEEFAGWYAVAAALLNLDETINK